MKNLKKHSSTQAICQLLIACEDAARDASMQKRIRDLQREAGGKTVSLAAEHELTGVLNDLRDALRRKYSLLAETCLARTVVLIERLPQQDRRREHMGLIKKIKAVIQDREKTAQDNLLAQQEAVAGNNVYTLEKKAAELSDQQDNLIRELKEKADICSRLDKTDPQYAAIKRQAFSIQTKIKKLEQQIRLCTKALQNNAQYQSMIQTGRMTKDLEQYQPDMSEAEAVLATITEKTKDLSEGIENFGDSMAEFDRKLSAALQIEPYDEDNEFDQMVETARSNAVVQPNTETILSNVEDATTKDSNSPIEFGESRRMEEEQT